MTRLPNLRGRLDALLLLGHRGARGLKTLHENTIPSFDRALADGCDGFEFDVRLTADGHAVVCHDPACKVSTGKKVAIARSTAKQLKNLPRLKDVLVRYHGRAFLDIELKVEGLEKITLDLLRRYAPQRGYVVSSFLPQVLERLRRRDAEVTLGLICETKRELRVWKDVPCQYVIAHQRLLSPELIGDLHAQGREVLVWTVNSTFAMKRFRKWGVDGIVSDKTWLLSETVG